MTQPSNGPFVPQIFDFHAHQVRSLIVGSQTWFAIVDICQAIEIQNPTQAALALDDDERAMFNIGRQGETNFTNESGLYALVLRSRKPSARNFAKWVTSVVLPTIRRTGSYSEALSIPASAGQRWLAQLDAHGHLQTTPLLSHLVLIDPTDLIELGRLINNHIPFELLPATANAAHHRLMYEYSQLKK